MIHLYRNPLRWYLFGRHVHHGLTGSIMIVAGVVLVATDWKDFPWRWVDDTAQYFLPKT